MNETERWNMYHKIQNLKALGLKKSQIARHLGVDRRTISRYLDIPPDEVHRLMKGLKPGEKN